MLFDLRSRGRRRTVQVLYITLAVLIGAGLILFGVGTGTGGGGLFGAFTGSGSSNNSNNAAVTAATKKAVKATQQHPDSAGAWASLVTARFSAANTTGFDSATSTYTPAGKAQLKFVAQAWKKYEHLATKPSANTAILAAHSYSALKQYSNAADAYQAVLTAEPGNIKGLECVSVMSYAAKNDRVGQLAETRVLAKLPKKARTQTKAQIEAVKKTPSLAGQLC